MKIYIEGLVGVLNSLDIERIKYLLGLIRKADRVWIIGNGGSASCASHYAEDFLKVCNKKAMSLSDVSLLTMSGNDEGYENVFLFPLSKLVDKEDLVIGLTTSGKSKNILNVMLSRKVKGKKFMIVGLGGKNVRVDKLVIQCKDMKILEDTFSVIGHLIVKFYRQK